MRNGAVEDGRDDDFWPDVVRLIFGIVAIAVAALFVAFIIGRWALVWFCSGWLLA